MVLTHADSHKKSPETGLFFDGCLTWIVRAAKATAHPFRGLTRSLPSPWREGRESEPQIVVLTHADSHKKSPETGLFFDGWKTGEETEQKSAQIYYMFVNHRSEILSMKEQVQLIRGVLAA